MRKLKVLGKFIWHVETWLLAKNLSKDAQAGGLDSAKFKGIKNIIKVETGAVMDGGALPLHYMSSIMEVYCINFLVACMLTPACIQLTGQVSILSLKGSPYWMAPEVAYLKLI